MTTQHRPRMPYGWCADSRTHHKVKTQNKEESTTSTLDPGSAAMSLTVVLSQVERFWRDRSVVRERGSAGLVQHGGWSLGRAPLPEGPVRGRVRSAPSAGRVAADGCRRRRRTPAGGGSRGRRTPAGGGGG